MGQTSKEYLQMGVTVKKREKNTPVAFLGWFAGSPPVDHAPFTVNGWP